MVMIPNQNAAGLPAELNNTKRDLKKLSKRYLTLVLTLSVLGLLEIEQGTAAPQGSPTRVASKYEARTGPYPR